MAKFPPLMALPPLLFVGLAAMFYFGMQRENPDALPSARQGGQAPPVVLMQLGDEVPLFDDDVLRQPGVKMVNYWASWCAPCRIEHPNLTLLASEGVPIYGINYKDNADNALKFLDDLGNPYVGMGADENGRMALNWGLYGVPETYIIDGEGVIVKRFAGPITARILEKVIRPALAEAEKN